MRVISISRRTDIPAFYTDWLMNRLRAGRCQVANPFSGKISEVSLRPEDCLALIFWTRNPAPLLPYLDEIHAMGHRCYAQVTVTGYPRALEPYAPDTQAVMDACRQLAGTLSPEFVVWRYDPILFSTLTTPEDHQRQFTLLAHAWEGHTRRCIISFTNYYAKTTRNLARVDGLRWEDPDPAARSALVAALAEIAIAHGVTLHACCEEALVSDHIRPAHCIDAGLIRELRPDVPPPAQAPSRPGCGCVASVDIGAYHTCLHGCTYCYATQSHAIAVARHRAHDLEAAALWQPGPTVPTTA